MFTACTLLDDQSTFIFCVWIEGCNLSQEVYYIIIIKLTTVFFFIIYSCTAVFFFNTEFKNMPQTCFLRSLKCCIEKMWGA